MPLLLISDTHQLFGIRQSGCIIMELSHRVDYLIFFFDFHDLSRLVILKKFVFIRGLFFLEFNDFILLLLKPRFEIGALHFGIDQLLL